ncbi:MAG: hypothetical protein NWE93_11215 [Candidatus Bathyarchaeota archaeon]|nr:hypothetical protein [Candidatus Bathyarchaeota archaeon]
MAKNFDVEDYNMVDLTAKTVLVALSALEKGLLAKGELLHKKTGLTPDEINQAVRSLATSLLVNLPDALKNSPPYEFYAVEITDFGRQVLEQFG